MRGGQLSHPGIVLEQRYELLRGGSIEEQPVETGVKHKDGDPGKTAATTTMFTIPLCEQQAINTSLLPEG